MRLPGSLKARETAKARMKRPVRRVLRAAGYELVPSARDQQSALIGLLQRASVSLVVDVGANQGQYAEYVRHLGYAGRIVSFEPGSKAFRLLETASKRDPLWETHNLALGERDGRATLAVSINSVSSSLLPVGERHLAAAPASASAAHESVPIARLDEVVAATGEATLLKVDAQGFELPVLKGAQGLLGQVQILQLEVSLVSLYDGQATYLELLSFIDELGFAPCIIIPGFADPENGELLQFDLVAKRIGLPKSPKPSVG